MNTFYDNMVSQMQTYGPSLVKAVLVLILFIVAAMIVSAVVKGGVDRLKMAKSANDNRSSDAKTIGASLGQGVFWFIVLMGLMQAFAIAGATQFSTALSGVIDPILFYLPKVAGAGIVFALFMILASVVKTALAAILAFLDHAPQKLGLTDTKVNISEVIAYIAAAVLIIVGAIASFDVLSIDAIAGPATDLLQDILNIVPNIIAAVVILGVFGFIAQYAGIILSKLLAGTKVNQAFDNVGLLKGADSNVTASSIIVRVTQFFIVVLGLVAALNALGIETLTMAAGVVLTMGAQIAFGALIIFAGVFIARLVASAMSATGNETADFAANAVKWIITILAVILGVSRMGLDPSADGSFILDAARILLIGGVAAAALAFGWGGRHWAEAQLEKFPKSGPSKSGASKPRKKTVKASAKK